MQDLADIHERCQHLSGVPKAEQHIGDVLPWLHDAGNPFYDWFYGGADATQGALHEMLGRRSSEMWIGHVRLLHLDDQPVGGYIAHAGVDRSRFAASDLLALVRQTPADQRAAVSARIKKALSVFPAVLADEFFLSGIGVLPAYRGRGLGKHLMQEYLAEGRAAGMRQFRLNVHADNHAAASMYRGFGFSVANDIMAADGRMRYWSMTLLP